MRHKFIRLVVGRVGLLAVVMLANLTLAQSCVQAQAVEASQVPKTVTVLGHPLVLKETKGGNPGEPFVAEYIPDGENWENWTAMYSARFVPDIDITPKAYAEALTQRILKRRQAGDNLVNAVVLEAADPNSAIADFVVHIGNEVEHNVWRYFRCKSGLVMLQIARRVYETKTNQQEVADFVKSVETKRSEILKEINRTDLPYRCY